MLEEEMKQLHLPDETDAYSNNFQDCLNKKKYSGLIVKKIVVWARQRHPLREKEDLPKGAVTP